MNKQELTFQELKNSYDMIIAAGMEGSLDHDNGHALQEILIDKLRVLIQEDLPDEIKSVAPETNNVVVTVEDSGYAKRELREQDEIYCMHCNSVFPASQLRHPDETTAWHRCGSRLDCDSGFCGGDLHSVLPAEGKSPFAMGLLLQWDTSLQEARRRGYLGEREVKDGE